MAAPPSAAECLPAPGEETVWWVGSFTGSVGDEATLMVRPPGSAGEPQLLAQLFVNVLTSCVLHFQNLCKVLDCNCGISRSVIFRNLGAPAIDALTL